MHSWEEGKESVWNFTVDTGEVSRQMVVRKRQVEEKLQQQIVKRQRLEEEVKDLKQKVETQSGII